MNYASLNLRNRINQEFTKITNYNLPEEIIDAIKKSQSAILLELEETSNIIIIPPLEIQRIQHLLAEYLLIPDERKTWCLYHIINSLIAIPEIKTLLVKAYGKNYETLIAKLRRYHRIIEQVKLDLDQLENKTDKDQKTPAYKRSQNNLSNMPIIMTELYQTLYIITKNTNLAQQKIPNQTIQTHERLNKKINYEEEEKRTPSPNPNQNMIGGETI